MPTPSEAQQATDPVSQGQSESTLAHDLRMNNGLPYGVSIPIFRYDSQTHYRQQELLVVVAAGLAVAARGWNRVR